MHHRRLTNTSSLPINSKSRSRGWDALLTDTVCSIATTLTPGDLKSCVRRYGRLAVALPSSSWVLTPPLASSTERSGQDEGLS